MTDNIVSKLALRETMGTLQPYSRANRLRLFKKCPQRFCIPLKSILDVNGDLMRGHVILGFTKSGKYLISYCLKIDSDDASPLPCYRYSLHWWQFNQQRPLVQVFCVALFDKEDIQQDLLLMVAESSDESTFVIYGETFSVKEEESRHCYVTICAAPSPGACQGCKSANKCLKHSFVVHFNYDLLPPFPTFIPSISLRTEDTVLINTGDFLMALKVLTFEENDKHVLEYLERSFVGISQTEDWPSRDMSSEIFSKEVGKINVSLQSSTEESLGMHTSENTSYHNSENSISDLSSFKTDTGWSLNSNGSDDNYGICGSKTHVVNKRLERHTLVSNFVNELNKIHLKKTRANDHHVSSSRETSISSHQGGHCDGNEKQAKFSGSDQVKESREDENHSSYALCTLQVLVDKGTVTCSSFEKSVDSLENQDKTEKVMRHCTGSKVSGNLNSPSNSIKHVLFRQMDSPDSRTDLNTLDYNNNDACDEDCCDSVHLKKEHGTCCTSCSIHPSVDPPLIYSENLTSSVLKMHTETKNNYSLDDVSDEFDLYDGSLPIKVTNLHGDPLKQVGKLNKNNPDSNQSFMKSLDNPGLHEQVLTVHQMTLDLEQCISEMIKAHEGLTNCYKSLRDYDVQIVDVCPDSGVVIVLARILVYTRKGQTPDSCGLPVSPSPELQSTGFLFSWKVCGGEVRILQVFGLDSYPENRKYRTFNVAAKEASEFRTKFSVPRSISSFVQAFSNHTVFTGKSLKYLRHPFLPLVLVL
ncbi:uncharacterized protein [Montipora capricornis]|uniref:uncharacterized protein n=1 Tax=Montipora capricornis TaxID=246305 RepID=UPI0035F21253